MTGILVFIFVRKTRGLLKVGAAEIFEQKINWGLTGVAGIDWGLALGVGQWQLGFDERLFVRLGLV
jgi:hypothetical protein